METKTKITAKIILWIARIWGTLILAFLLFFVLAHIFGDEDKLGGFLNTKEVVIFFFFPVCTILGLSLALKWEGLGGLISTVGIIGLFVLRSDLLSSLIFIGIIAPPGLLYLIYWYISKHRTTTILSTKL